MTTHTHDEFFGDFLEGLGLPNTIGRRRALAAVSMFESSLGQLHWWDPLACTLVVPGSKPLYPGEDPCAQIYPSYKVGVSASVQLFSGPHWDDVRKAIKRHRWRKPILEAFSEAYTWVSPRPDFYGWYSLLACDTRRRLELLGP